ncbi:glycosyltransferase family protein [Pseudomonas eucalypticola]|uniref:Glycosyltransferase family 1 protein n=1 Tax=Pseudomonas eucalypticola TaxID=2599595 RepID=A0A7D5D4F9_9PSED|nr:glycosyltransferase [Pseudomonas eucalypticola]QKZ02737.1 glycosyltransferase family 1 protein [Pseudomonas eucalypticola]
MKVLFLVQKEQRVILDRLYQAVAEHCECDLRWLDSADQRDLRGYFRREVNASQYDRILFFLRFKQEVRQVAFIRSVPNLVILEHDAYQNYIDCKYTGKFSRHYRNIPWARVISSGFQVTERLRQEGVDAVFVAKGYDQTLLRDLGAERDIELAFVGSTNSVAYSGRKVLLDELGARENLLVTRTKSGEDYLNTLNRIRFFVGADVGMGEYMIKNFEAMACGCVLLAWDQGEVENQALGFVDMHNLVLYRSVEQLQEKLAVLRADPQLARRIALNGQQLVQSQYSFARIGEQIVEAMRPALRPAALRGGLGEWWLRLRRALAG